MALALVGMAALGIAFPSRAAEPRGENRLYVVVIDPGHGGPDHGARGSSGLLEKDLVLRVGRRIGALLDASGVSVVYTRTEDRFVSLSERTFVANRAKGDLYLSIHANASGDETARGAETYFLSVDASDEDARRVAETENQVFDREGAVPDSGDIVGAILSDLIRTEHLRGSSEIAGAIQHELERLPGPSRGVKQAPFVVLMGVNMPAALLEIGFLTHPEEERWLGSTGYQRRIAEAVAHAVQQVRERHGTPPGEEATP